MLKSKVMLLKVTPTLDENIYSSLKQAISSIADPPAFSDAKKVIIKVNLCKPFPADSGATVDIRITENMVKLILEQNPRAEIYVVESDSGSRDAERAFRETGYLSLEKRCKNLRIVNLSKTGQIMVDDRRFRYFKKGLSLSSLFLDCDYFVSVSKLKTHEFERFTGILKNQFGCISTKNKEQYHPYLSEVIGDVNSILKPDLCIIDGLVAMEGKGPSFGDPKEMNLLIIGNDPVATDAIAATVMGIDPHSVPHLKSAAKRGLGEIELGSIHLAGEKIEEARSNFNFVPARVLRLFRLSFQVRRLARFFAAIGGHISFVGRQLERLGRALYIRSFTEIVKKRVFTPFAKKLKLPKPIFRALLTLYMTMRRLTS